MIKPWYTAVEPFDPISGEVWTKYIESSGLTQLKELISLDGCLCPELIGELNTRDWDYNIQENFCNFYFRDLDYLLERIGKVDRVNILAVLRNPQSECISTFTDPRFEFKGYDLVEVAGTSSALSNCGGVPMSFTKKDLSDVGLIPLLEQANKINRSLRKNYPNEHHADCDVWALCKMKTPSENNNLIQSIL